MHLSQLKAGQLDAYLESLTPKAAAFLMREVERDKLRGGDAYPHDLILQRVRGLLRAPHEMVERTASPERLFCAPFEDMLVDISTEDKQLGRIRRSSADAVWNWLVDELFPDIADRFAGACDCGGRVPYDSELSEKLGEIYEATASRLRLEIDGLEEGTKEYRKAAAQIGGEAALEDAFEISSCLAVAGDMLRLRARLPQRIRDVSAADLPPYQELYNEFQRHHPAQAYILVVSILARAERVSDALRILCGIAGSEEVPVLEAHHLSIVIDVVLHDIEISCDMARRAVISRAKMPDVEERLREFHDLASGLQDAIELLPRGHWGSRLVTLRANLSSAIKDQISAAPRMLKTALFPKAAIVPGSGPEGRIMPPDAQNIADAEFAIRLLTTTRFFLDQLSINAEYSDVKRQVEQFMEAVGERILRELRRESEADQKACLIYMDGAGRMIRYLFGDEAAALFLRRGRASNAQAKDAAATAG